jgi:methyl-accepting chemotaxis protein
MVVDEPRNEHNRGDEVAMTLLRQIKEGKPEAARSAGKAYYYARPIRTAKTCLACHGEPRGEPDPFFPQYTKNGWREGEVIGAVVARVAPAEPALSR